MAPLQAILTIFSSWTPHGGAALGHATHDTVAAVTTAAINPTQIGLLVGGIVILLVVTARHRRTRMTAGRSISRSDQRRGKATSDATLREVEAVMAQLDQLSRQIHGKIDLKLATLQSLIREADQRIDQLSRLQRGSRGEATFDVELESETPESPNEVVPQGPHDAVYRLADSGYTPLQIARELARHTGEVELILSLRRAKHAPTNTAVRSQAG